ncbi:hypothetical protein PW5551_09665 [Petrotoga sp. 9PW.55.5.1]|uniref:alpha/beta hydrolase n=1 Tax=Petrotoga sp. 9PW.55.5.1 TaxID=1308979 RepID=UPI000DC2197D|nr:alpha/beta hydrolase family protein [Petrotoga sp. 9PW.55.5.1]RAO98473.1 hypothetical protein PW5551_09665 [Petrotoga sp. 9PW.55.5.1]
MNKGIFYESNSFYSEKIRGNMRYSIYLPSNYNNESRKYPVIYLLHGHDGNEISWKRKGLIDQTFDSMIEQGEMPPMVAVMPDAKNSWYVNSPSGIMYESALVEDLTEYIQKNYKVYSNRENRFIAGISMGGYGALKLAFKYPDKFLAAASLSGAILKDVPPEKETDLDGNEIKVREKFYHDAYGEPFDPVFWEKENVFNYIQNLKDCGLELPVYISCGNEDYFYLYQGAVELYHQLRKNKIPTELYIKNGNHDWLLWSQEIKEVLKFITRSIQLY